MPSASDFLNGINGIRDNTQGANDRLDQVEIQLDAVRGAVEQVGSILNTDLGQLITLDVYKAQALFQNDLQNDTIICLLGKIAKNTCDLVNQSHVQTVLQTSIQKNTAALERMYAMTHAEAALAREREACLRHEIEKCCPPEPPTPPCHDDPCPAPEPIGPPPQVGGVIL